MPTITISAKVPTEMADRIFQSGYTVSNLIQVSLDIFLEMDKIEQDKYMLRFIQEKKLNKALDKYLSPKNDASKLHRKKVTNF